MLLEQQGKLEEAGPRSVGAKVCGVQRGCGRIERNGAFYNVTRTRKALVSFLLQSFTGGIWKIRLLYVVISLFVHVGLVLA